MSDRLCTASDVDLPAVGALRHRSQAAARAGLVAPGALTFGSGNALGVGRALMGDALPHLGPGAVPGGNERARGELTHQLRYARTAAR